MTFRRGNAAAVNDDLFEMTMLAALTIHEAHDKLARKEISSVKLTEAIFDRIEKVDPALHVFLHLARKSALAQAQAADERRAKGEDTPLLGVPLAIKDVICLTGMPATAGSKILQGFVPPYDATVVARLRALGAVFLGKTNTDEFAMGSSTENSAFGVTRNPWDTERVPGGSSGGSAAAVAADLCLGAFGTDTGGSIRQPASLCSVVGVKPSYGRVSRYGLIAFASSLDQIGPLAKDVRDAAILLRAIAGHDPLDATSMPIEVPDYTAYLRPEVKGVRIGVPREYFIDGMQPEVDRAIHQAVDVLKSLGAEIREVSLPHTDFGLPVYYLIAPAEASANLARFDGVRYGLRVDGGDMWSTYKATRGRGFGPEVKRRIMIGTYALSTGYYDAYYLKAQKVRTLIKGDYEAAFKEVDVIACPTSPTTAFKIGEKVNNPLQMYLSDVFTLNQNLAGICGLALPCGFDGQGLPIGLQLNGPAFGEEKIIHVAHAYEQATEWHRRKPPVKA